MDPGEWFDWRRLATAGVGLWSEAGDDGTIGDGTRGDGPDGDAGRLMQRFGYRDASPYAIAAFQRHFRPGRITGIADGETLARLSDLVDRAGKA